MGIRLPCRDDDAFSLRHCLERPPSELRGNYPYNTDEQGPSLERTTEVGKYAVNAWGLYDMHGNVGQWCADYYDGEYYANSDIKDPFNSLYSHPGRRVLRGGSWSYVATTCRAAYRNRFAPEVRNTYFGFRVCLPLD